MGFVMRDVPTSHPDFGKAIRCTCKTNDDVMRRRRYLLGIDGLTVEERTHVLENYELNEGNQTAYEAVLSALHSKHGMITLNGDYGRGKTELLICAVNAARDVGIPAVYATSADVLDYLRKAYKPGSEIDIDERWELLVGVDVLALDELEKFSATEWAMDRFTRLIDLRWRAIGNKLTLFATNAAIGSLPGNIASRLEDARGQVVRMTGRDMRKGAT